MQIMQTQNKSAEKSLFWNQITTTHSAFNPLIAIKSDLQSKYAIHFSFFMSKPVNQIIYELTSRQVTQNFIDSKMISEQVQYMKRYYHLQTQEGIPEINDRIKMLGQFYNMSDKYLKYQYPMMVITNTKEIFQKRQRRMKKISAGQGSSDQTEEKSSFFCYSFDTQHFLKDLSNVSKMYKYENQKENQVSFDSDVHDTYLRNEYHQLQRSKRGNLFFERNFTEQSNYQQKQQHFFDNLKNVDHLICEFNNEEVQISIPLLALNKQQGRQSLKNIINREQRRSTNNISLKNHSLLPQLEENSKQTFNSKRTSFLSSYLSLFENKYRKMYLSGEHSNLATADLKTTTDQNDVSDKYQLKKIDQMIQKQKQEKQKNRRRIRQKAQQLLRKVRVNSNPQ